MIKFFTIPGYARIKPNLTPEKEQVVLQSLNGKAVIGFRRTMRRITDDLTRQTLEEGRLQGRYLQKKEIEMTPPKSEA